jgi:hypothetical protein
MVFVSFFTDGAMCWLKSGKAGGSRLSAEVDAVGELLE